MEFQKQTDSRRRSNRKQTQTPVVLRLTPQTLEGQADSLSPGGVLLFSNGSLEVEVQFEEDGVLKTRTGRLARSERVSATRQSWAIEFDDAG